MAQHRFAGVRATAELFVLMHEADMGGKDGTRGRGPSYKLRVERTKALLAGFDNLVAATAPKQPKQPKPRSDDRDKTAAGGSGGAGGSAGTTT